MFFFKPKCKHTRTRSTVIGHPGPMVEEKTVCIDCGEPVSGNFRTSYEESQYRLNRCKELPVGAQIFFYDSDAK